MLSSLNIVLLLIWSWQLPLESSRIGHEGLLVVKGLWPLELCVFPWHNIGSHETQHKQGCVKLANGWLYQGQRPGLMFELECNRVSPGGRDGRAHLPEVGGAPCHPEGPFSTAGATWAELRNLSLKYTCLVISSTWTDFWDHSEIFILQFHFWKLFVLREP